MNPLAQQLSIKAQVNAFKKRFSPTSESILSMNRPAIEFESYNVLDFWQQTVGSGQLWYPSLMVRALHQEVKEVQNNEEKLPNAFAYLKLATHFMLCDYLYIDDAEITPSWWKESRDHGGMIFHKKQDNEIEVGITKLNTIVA